MAFVYDDGFGNAVDESEHHVLDMDVDEYTFPLHSVTDYNKCMALKLLEQEKVNSAARSDESAYKPANSAKRRLYADYGNKQKEDLFFLVYEKNLTAGKAAKQLEIPRRAGYN
ncbi:hypothetical protein G6F43_002361 [Rhizopus delemar]|nr:hypothetical protein G6F43_002361 [Rhizopus delemar]